MELRSFKSFFGFVIDMFTHVWSGLAGSCSVVALLYGNFLARQSWQGGFTVTAVIAFVVAAFLVWRREHEALEALKIEKLALSERLLALTKPSLELVFDEGDARCIRDKNRLHYFDRWWLVGIKNTSYTQTLYDVSLKAQDSALIKYLVSDFRTPVTEPVLMKPCTIHPQAVEFVEMMSVSSNINSTSDQETELLRKPHRFTLEARAKDALTIMVDFEYLPTSPPSIKRIYD